MAFLDSYAGAWTNEEAGHLLRRAGFGGSPAQRATVLAQGLDVAVDTLVDFQPQDPHLDAAGTAGTGGPGDPLATLPDDDSDLGIIKNPSRRHQLSNQWLYRMSFTTQPLQEQYALFLHDHFVSEWYKCQDIIRSRVNYGNDGDGLEPEQRCTGGTLARGDNENIFATTVMLDQCNLFRRTAIGDFRQTLIDITRDPAMLIYLDNWTNEKGRAQENYAREIMELFSMGVDNYSEDDVQQVARCLTGETLPYTACEDDYQYTVSGFVEDNHEPGNKTVFGSTVSYDGTGKETEDVIDLILSRISVNPDVSGLPAPHNTLPATAVYMSWKLIRWFVNQDVVLLPTPDAVVLELADYMVNTANYNMREVLRTLFKSTYFYDSANRYNMIKNPADFVVSTFQALGIYHYSTYSPDRILKAMGMSLYHPPNVAGWNHGNAWITSGTVLNRFNYGYYLGWRSLTSEYYDALSTANGGPFEGDGTDSDDDILAYYVERMLHGFLTAEEESTLREFLNTTPASGTWGYEIRIKGLVHLIMSMPRYNLK
jgi:uncharacterized protein (DUF1800 family)